MVIGYHIILTGYGHWLPNDPRGSLSHVIYAPEIAKLGPSHYGPKEDQPSAAEMISFQRKAERSLHYPLLWWCPQARQELADAIGEVVITEGLTCYACAVLASHIHLLFRRHRMKAEAISPRLKEAGRARMRQLGFAPADHPVFSADPCHHFKSTPDQISECVGYIADNYAKHGVEPAVAPWVTVYDGWPHGMSWQLVDV
ncbi:MAG: hypothetical protein ACE15C_07090 [Phycisphaerae bacterium]